MVRTVILNTKNEEAYEAYTSKPRELVFVAEFNALGELSMTQTAGNKQMDQETLLRSMSLAMMEFAGSLAQDGTKKARTKLQERFRDMYASTLMNYWVNDAWESSGSLMEAHDGGDQKE